MTQKKTTNRIARLPLAALLALSLTACGEVAAHIPGHAPGVTVVLVDGSGSVAQEDREIHLRSLEAVAEGLEGGDRLLVGPIDAQARWRPAFDATVASSNIRLDQQDAIAETRAQFEARIPTLLPGADGGAGLKDTRLLEAIAAASQAFGTPPYQQAELILLSDAVEESPTADLSGSDISSEEIEAALDRAAEAGLLRDMTGLKLTIAGAGGADYAAVEAFWRAWCERTGATLVSYGRLPYRAGK